MEHRRFDDIKDSRRLAMSSEERAESDTRSERLMAALLTGIAIRDAREAAGVTQTELASRIGIAQSALSRMEAGRSNITLVTLTRVATALKAPLSVRIGDSEAALV